MMTRLACAIAMWLVWFLGAAAHEVRTTIGDLTVDGSGVALDLYLSAEAFAAGIDLDGVQDINATPQSEEYDRLRALEPEALAEIFAPVAGRMASEITIIAGQSEVPLSVTDIFIDLVGNPDLPRDSRLRLTGMMPGPAETIVLRWPEGYGTLILRQLGVEGPFTDFLDGGQSSPPVAIAGSGGTGAGATFVRYVPLGFDHILPRGPDHALVILGLFLLSLRLGPIAWQVAAFTLGYLVTLVFGVMGVVTLPTGVLGPLIAASLLYVAVDNLVASRLTSWRVGAIFLIGLVHGVGFAAGLDRAGVPPGQIGAALAGFALGLELAQMTVIALGYILVGYWFGDRPWYRARIVRPVSFVLAAFGAWWLIQRLLV